METKKKKERGSIEQPKEMIRQLITSEEEKKAPNKNKRATPLNLNNLPFPAEAKVPSTNNSPTEKPEAGKSQMKSRMAS